MIIYIYVLYIVFVHRMSGQGRVERGQSSVCFRPWKIATVDLQLQELKVSKEELGASRKVTFGNPFFLMQRGSEPFLKSDVWLKTMFPFQNFRIYDDWWSTRLQKKTDSVWVCVGFASSGILSHIYVSYPVTQFSNMLRPEGAIYSDM